MLLPTLTDMEISIPIELQAKLTRLAAQQGRDSGSLIVEAVERMVDYDEWFLTAVEKGLAQIENGQTLSHQDAGQRIEKYLTLKQPQV